MTGIERLRKLIKDYRTGHECDGFECRELTCGECMAKNVLEPIADQIEREMTPHDRRDEPADGHAADVSMSAYDLLPQDEREAIAWVREHGGLSHVKDEWNHSRNLKRSLETAKDKVERQQLHIMFVQRKCRERQNHIVELNKKVSDMRPRLMPEGMEWPMVDGKPVVIGERVRSCGIDDCKVVGINPAQETLTLASDDIEKGKVTYFTDFAKYCHRPAPKALDADGAEIRAGDTVWHVETGEQCKVVEVDSRSVSVDFRVGGDGAKHTGSILPANLTHRAPVLASDGKPLREGETVWDVLGKRQFTVLEIGPDTMLGGYNVNTLGVDGMGLKGWSKPSDLTHERPDSWERLEEDVANASCPDVYCSNHHIDASDTSYEWAMARDLVRRAKALVGDA